MARIPTNTNCVWNYSFCELDEDWYSVGNIEYDALNDLRGDYPHLSEDEVVEIPTNGWDGIT
jgi:hypothetical protein